MKIRLAQKHDISALSLLIEQSARQLSKNDYNTLEIEAAIQYVFGVDRELITDQTYYLIEKNQMIVACGGWSKRRTLFGGSQCNAREDGYLNPESDYAKIRAFFVHPDYVRQGLGKKLLKYCEEQAWFNGFVKIEMMATLPGVKLYQAFGYQAVSSNVHQCPNGQTVKFIRMTKNIKPPFA